MLIAFVSLSASSADYHFVHDGLYYLHAYSDDECWLTNNPDDPYAGKINVPSTVIDEEGRTRKVVAIMRSAFSDCVHLTEVTLPPTITSINGTAFYGCTALKTVHLPESINYIGNHCFMTCSSLTAVKLPSTLKHIKDGVFTQCPLKEVELPVGLETIGKQAFYHADKLKEISIPRTVKKIGSSWLYSNNIEQLTFCDGKEAIEAESSLGEAVLPALKALYLGRNILVNFDNYYIQPHRMLESIVLGDYVTDARFVAFPHMWDVNLISLTSNALTPPLVNGFHESLYSKITPTIDTEAYEAYCNAEYWKDFPEFTLQNGLSAVEIVEGDRTEQPTYYNLYGVYVGSAIQFCNPGYTSSVAEKSEPRFWSNDAQLYRSITKP